MNEVSIAVLSLAACLFASSVGAKLHSLGAYQSFRAGMRETALMPDRLLRVVVAVLPCAEAVTAAGLATAAGLVATAGPGAKPAAEVALITAATLTGLVSAGVAVIMHRGTQARCACFGAGSGRPLGVVHLTRNLTLLAVVAAGLSCSLLGHGPPVPAATVVSATAGAMAALLFVRWEDLAELFAPIPSAHSGTPAIQRPHNRPG